MGNLGTIQTIAVLALPLIFAITLHEAAHGLVAMFFGDKTAYMMGRVTANPVKHIDPIGTIVVPLVMYFMSGFIFGWAKPVPVTQENLNNPKRDMAFVALAGPLSNFLMAWIWAIIAKLATLIVVKGGMYATAGMFLYYAGFYGVMINVFIMILNLLPIPPLDGSRIVSSLIPNRWDAVYSRIEPYGFWILIGLLVFGVLTKIIIGPARHIIFWMLSVFGLH